MSTVPDFATKMSERATENDAVDTAGSSSDGEASGGVAEDSDAADGAVGTKTGTVATVSVLDNGAVLKERLVTNAVGFVDGLKSKVCSTVSSHELCVARASALKHVLRSACSNACARLLMTFPNFLFFRARLIEMRNPHCSSTQKKMKGRAITYFFFAFG